MYEFDLYTGEDDPITVVTDEIEIDDVSVAEGAFIKYSVVADDEIEVKEIKTVSDAVAINGFDASTIAFSDDKNLDLADGYVVIGADTKDADNIVGGSLRKADTISGVTYLNAVYFTEDNEVAAVFMGNENRIYGADGKAMTLGNASLEKKTYDVTDKVTLGNFESTSTATVSPSGEVEEGTEVTVTITATTGSYTDDASRYVLKVNGENTSANETGTENTKLTYTIEEVTENITSLEFVKTEA